MSSKKIQIIYDERLPDSSLPNTDPSNPRNIVKTALMLADQTNADTKYDITSPPREIAGFTNPSTYPSIPTIPSFVLVWIIVTLLAILLIRSYSTPVRVVFAIAVILAIHGLSSRVN